MMQKDCFLLGNQQIERAIHDFQQGNRNYEGLQQVLEAVRQRMNEDGHFLIPVADQTENGFQWLSVTAQNGNQALVAFTAPEQTQTGRKTPLVSQYIDALCEFALQSKDMAGIMLNPWSEAFLLSKEELAKIFADNERLGDGRRIVVTDIGTKAQCIVPVPDNQTVSDLTELVQYYSSALNMVRNKAQAVLPALYIDGLELVEVAGHTARILHDLLERDSKCKIKLILFCNEQEQLERYDTALRLENAHRATVRFEVDEMRANRAVVKKSDWDGQPMPDCHIELSIEYYLSDIDKEVLRYGNLPCCMEDKWFWYVENDILYAHRSWTGNCIYMIDLSGKHELHSDKLRVMINHDMSQNPWTVLDEAVEELQHLLSWWVQPVYDYYNEWLEETARAMAKQQATQQAPTPVLSQQEDTLVIERKDYRAIAVDRGKEFVVLQGSTINPSITGVMPNKALEMRAKGLQDGFISEHFELLEDVVFGSSSAAAAFVVGHTVSGPKTWKKQGNPSS